MSKNTKLKFILKNLQTLLGAGVPLSVSLQIIEKRVKGNKNGDLLLQVREIGRGLASGSPFGQVLQTNFPHNLSPSLRLFIKIGESSGNLDKMISRGLDIEEKMQKIRSSLIGALSYPLFILGLSLCMIVAMLIFVVPKITPMFRDLKVELPIYTKILIFISAFISKYALVIILLGSLILGSVMFAWKKSVEFRNFVENVLFSVPFLKGFLINYNLSTISICLSEYLKSGYSVHDSFKTISAFVKSQNYRLACLQIGEEIRAGLDLGEAILKFDRIMPNWTDPIGFAVNSGKLPEQFHQFYIESSNLIDQFGVNLKRWSEPLLIIGIGSIVALFAVSIISPIYGLVQHIGT